MHENSPRENKLTDIWYLYHSGFAADTGSNLLIFDYYREADSKQRAGTGEAAALLRKMRDKKVFVFASHSHPDHFSEAVFDWQSLNPSIAYVLSDDIKAAAGRGPITFVRPGRKYEINGLRVEVFGSTDEGVSFLVTVEGKTIFHAGDLNWWHWKGEPDQDNLAMAEAYKKQIARLAGRHIDIAFIPVDPRLEEYYHLGLRYFLEEVGSRHVFPMHFWENYSVFDSLKKDLPDKHRQSVIEITREKRHFRL